MHPIQRHILKKLTLGKNLRYKDLKPKEVEGNQFMYHLGVVTDHGYVKKVGVTYSLTIDGKMYADRVELETFLPKVQPKIVSMLHCTNKKSELLLFRRKRSPLFNLVHLPYGKLHMGETVQDAAKRELKEKTGLSADLSHIGDIYVRVYDGDELLAHILHHIFSGKNLTGRLLEETNAGVPFWSETNVVNRKEYVGGFREIIEIISKNKKKFFFEEFDLHLPKNNTQT
tara:strand:+ start:5843 stop:6526 length:684 start_codon:yes stop_codon:yes gene_type:complete